MEIIGSLIISISQSILFYGKEIGISMIIFILIANGIIGYILNRKNKIKNKKAFLLMIPIMLLASTYFIFSNTIFHIANFAIIILLNLLMYLIATDKKKYFMDYIYSIFEIVANTVFEVKDSLEFTKNKAKKNINTNHKIDINSIKKIGISFLIVFAIVGVVIILLASADSLFAEIFSGIGDMLKNINVGNVFSLILRLVIIALIYFLCLNFILKIQEMKYKEKQQIKEKSDKYNFTIKLLLIALNIVYLVFCYIQVKSLFAKINLDSTFNYAEYARSGFFQLMFVSLINFVVILISTQYNVKKEKLIKILDLLLIVFTIIIVLSSMFRMYMYEAEFGLTYLRIFVYIILLTELIIFIPTTIYIFNTKLDLLKWYATILMCVYVVANFANIERIIIYKNLNKNTSEVPIDYEYISKIATEDSYDILKEQSQKEDVDTKEKLKLTRILLKIVNNEEEMKWQEFNISKYKLQNEKDNIRRFRESNTTIRE